MTQKSKKGKERSRKRWWPVFAVGILGLHAVVFLVLAQYEGRSSGYQKQVSYINVQNIDRSEVSFGLREPPERMFYQFASMPLTENEEELLPLSEPRWSGYETLVALKAEDYTPIENYRLTIDFEKDASRRVRPVFYWPEFRTIVVRGVSVRPVLPVPEPGLASLLGLAVLGFLGVRRRV